MEEHGTNFLSHNMEQNPFVVKIICGENGKVFWKDWQSSTGETHRKRQTL